MLIQTNRWLTCPEQTCNEKGFEADDEEENSLNEDGRVCGVSVQTGSGGSGAGFGRFARHG